MCMSADLQSPFQDDWADLHSSCVTVHALHPLLALCCHAPAASCNASSSQEHSSAFGMSVQKCTLYICYVGHAAASLQRAAMLAVLTTAVLVIALCHGGQGICPARRHFSAQQSTSAGLLIAGLHMPLEPSSSGTCFP